MKNELDEVRFPGTPAAMDGNTAVISCERESSDAAGAYPITPSTQMGEYWAEAAAAGHVNISGRPLIFVEPEGEHAAAAVTAGMAMTGLRAANFSSGQGIAYMHESLYAAAGKRLPYVLNIGARAMTKSTLNVHAGHDDYHCIDDTGFFQLFACNAQGAADLNVIAHRIAEMALTPGAVAQDGFLTTHLIESMRVPERELIETFLGRPDDVIDTPTPAQRIVYGEKRRRIPMLWDVDNPVMAGLVENQDAYMQSVAAQRPFFFDHVRDLADDAFEEFARLTGRRYARIGTYRTEGADYLIVGQGSLVPYAEVVADYLAESRGIKVGVVDVTMFRPFPADLLSAVLRGRKGVTVLERLDQPLAGDLPLMREIRATVSKCIENGRDDGALPYPDLDRYTKPKDAPPLYSGSFGMGSRDLQPEGLIGAVENMLPDGGRKRLFYLSIDFLRKRALTPKQEIYQQTIEDAYPHVRELALRGSENPNLMPEGSITVRLHSIGGWGAITTGKNLAMTLYSLLGYDIKANPKYGSEKKGQPTTFYLSAAPEPIKVNCEYFYVDVVLSPDPNVFHHTNALAGLKDGGTFIIQSDLKDPASVWASIPIGFQQTIVEKGIRVFFLDAFSIARDEATDADLQLRMQGVAFQGAFFAASTVLDDKGLDEGRLLREIRAQLEYKFGDKGARVVEDNMRAIKRGHDELVEILDKPFTLSANAGDAIPAEPPLPTMVKRLPESQSATSDIHRFWEQTGNFYARGMGSDNITDPFVGLGTMPALSSLFRDMTGIRFEHPEWIPENCTACGDCYTVCPDTAIPGLVNEVGEVLDTVVKRVRKNGGSTEHLPRAVRSVERHLRSEMVEAGESASVAGMLEGAIEKTLAEADAAVRPALSDEFGAFRDELNGFQFAVTRPYFTLPERKQAGDGGLLSITVDPYTCKGCMECVKVCDDDALRPVTQTDASIEGLRKNWDLWLDLPNTPRKYVRIDDLEERIGALETLLLDKDNYLAFASGDGACLGCSEKTVMHVFVATVEALMQPRVKAHVAHIETLIESLRQRVQDALVGDIDLGNAEEFERIVEGIGDGDVTLAGIAGRIERDTGGRAIDPDWLRRVTTLIGELGRLKWQYTDGTTGGGRSSMGMLNATGCTSVWGSTYPYNPYPFPWANHLFQDTPSLAMGVFEGHMAKMADGFRTIRLAELELSGEYRPSEHDEFFTYFDWQSFSDTEFKLCPPVVAVGGDGAMYDIGFQNLSRMMMSGKPIKALVVDTQVYSNTGGQACTSGFFSQVSDMAQFGKAIRGKEEIRKEIGLVGMAHRTTYVLQGAISNASHMIEGFIEGLLARRPALFNLYTSCQPEHGIGDDMGAEQARLAVESRAYPLFRYDPDRGHTPAECFDLSGNPDIHSDWPSYTLRYLKNGREQSMELPLTFADFAMTETRFRKHFRMAPPDTWNDKMLPLHEFLNLDEVSREGRFPFIWTVDRQNRLSRLLVDEAMVRSCEDRRSFWTMLRALAGIEDPAEPAADVESRIRREVIANIARGLAEMADGNAVDPAGAEFGTPDDSAAPAEAAADTAAAADYMAPWLDTDDCTACDECIKINPAVFEYNADGKAVIANADGGPYSDLVKAAEKCTAEVIHPGLPRDRSAGDIEKWIARGEKYN